MFGRRKVPPRHSPDSPPPPPGGKEPFPIDKMDRALDGAIRLLTRTFDEANVHAGKLAIRGPVPSGVTGALAECTSYRGQDDGSLTSETVQAKRAAAERWSLRVSAATSVAGSWW